MSPLRKPATVARLLALIGALLLWALALAALVAAQQEPLTEAFTFVVFGDNRPRSATGPQPKAFRKIAYEIGQLQPDFVVGLGDYIHGAADEATVRKQWTGFFNALVPMRANKDVPFVPVAGNHDIGGSRRNQQIFIEYLHYAYYSFDWGGCHFIALNSELVGEEGRIAGHQLGWLKADLAAHGEAPLTFAFLHRPLFPVDGHVGSSLDVRPQERDALHQLFLDNGVDCVFAGHEHLFNASSRDGLTYVISGGAGAPLYAPPDKGGFHHYLVVKVENGRYKIEVRRPKEPY